MVFTTRTSLCGLFLLTVKGGPFFLQTLQTGNKVLMAKAGLHVKCRYPNEYLYRTTDAQNCQVSRTIARGEVPDELVPWSAAFDAYDPVVFNAPQLKTATWADPDIQELGFRPRWHEVDEGKVDRRSHEGEYPVRSGVALNIRGRTGLAGRGVLGRYGPNHAADPIVTRWKRSSRGHEDVNSESGKKVLQFVAIQRRDTDEWAIPGGMVDPGEHVNHTVKREFMEEALDSTGQGRQAAIEDMKAMVDEFFSKGIEVYRGYVDDPRNTDNAWMETVAFLFHDDTGVSVGKFDLAAGDDAKDLRWVDVSGSLRLYASHANLIKKAAEKLSAHW